MTASEILAWLEDKAASTGDNVSVDIRGSTEVMNGDLVIGLKMYKLDDGIKPPATLEETLTILIEKAEADGS